MSKKLFHDLHLIRYFNKTKLIAKASNELWLGKVNILCFNEITWESVDNCIGTSRKLKTSKFIHNLFGKSKMMWLNLCRHGKILSNKRYFWKQVQKQKMLKRFNFGFKLASALCCVSFNRNLIIVWATFAFFKRFVSFPLDCNDQRSSFNDGFNLDFDSLSFDQDFVLMGSFWFLQCAPCTLWVLVVTLLTGSESFERFWLTLGRVTVAVMSLSSFSFVVNQRQIFRHSTWIGWIPQTF